MLAFLIGGMLGTFIGWRPVVRPSWSPSAALVFVLSFQLKPDTSAPEVKIDMVGVLLAAAAIIMITLRASTT